MLMYCGAKFTLEFNSVKPKAMRGQRIGADLPGFQVFLSSVFSKEKVVLGLKRILP